MLVTWETRDPSTDRWDINARRFSEAGLPLGNEFRVNTETGGNQRSPAVATGNDGQSLITWQSHRQDGSGWGVFAQRFSPDGSADGPEFQVNETTSGSQIKPSVTFLPNGDVAVAWSGRGESDDAGVFLRIFDENGVARTGEILANETQGGAQEQPSLTTDSFGRIVAAWSGDGADGRRGVHARQFDADGTALTSEIQVSQPAGRGNRVGTQSDPAVVADNQGGFIVGWEGKSGGDGHGALFRHFDSNGNPLIDVTLANETKRGRQSNTSILWTEEGYVVSWNGKGAGDSNGVYVREFDAFGTPLGTAQRVNQTVRRGQANSTLTHSPSGFTVVWSGGGDGDNSGVFLRRYGTQPPSSSLPPILTAIGDKTTTEGSLLTFTVDATDPDVPAQTLTYSLDAGAPAGATIDGGSGEFRWATNESNGPQSYDVTFRVSDGEHSDFETITIHVLEENQVPVLAAIGNRTISESGQLTFTANATDADVPTQQLTFSLGLGAPSSASINSSSGLFEWTPTEADGPGTFDITVIATDSEGGSDSEQVLVVVEEANQSPSLASVTNKSVVFGNSLSFAANATDADVPFQTLTYSLTAGAPAGATINSGTGQFSWTPSMSQAGATFGISIAVSDNAGGTDTETFEVTVVEDTQPSEAPELSAIGNRTVDEGGLVTFTATATDADTASADLSFSIEPGAPAGAGIHPDSGVFTWQTTESDGPGSFDIIVRVTDDDGLSDTETITIDVDEVNQFPILSAIGSKTVGEGNQLTFVATATDQDLPSQALTYQLGAGAPTGAQIHATSGVFSWTPVESDGPGTFDVTVLVTDTEGASDSEIVTITVLEVNQPPELQPIGTQSVAQGQQLTFQAVADDADSTSQNLMFSLDTGAPVGASIDPASGVFTWTPTPSDGAGTFSVSIRVTDGGGASDAEAISVNVAEPNQPPVLVAIGNQTASEGQVLNFTANATDTDTAVDNLRFGLGEGAPSGATIGAVSGVFSWVPGESHGPGTATVVIQVTDGEGGTDSESVTISIAEVNQAPVLSSIGSRSVAEGSELTFSASANDGDLPTQALTFSLDSGAPAGANIDSATGDFSWTPGEVGVDDEFDVTIRVSDSEGATDSETFTITVNEANQSPVLAAIGDRDASDGVELTFTATATDADLPAQTLTFSLDSGAPAAASIDAASGVFSWIPAEADSPDTHNITVRVTDSAGASAAETITVTVSDTNSAPVLDSIGDLEASEGERLTFTATGTDSDVPTQTLTYSLDAGAPATATIDSSTGVFDWTPAESFGGSSVDVSIRVTDSIGASDFETITINVTETNQVPVLGAIGDRAVRVDTLLTFTATANDADDPADSLTFSLDSGAPASAAIDASTGVFTWTPAEADGAGPFPVTVRVSDGTGASDFETISIRINTSETNSPPTLATVGNRTVEEESELRFTVSATDPDLPTDVVMYSLAAGAPAAAVINPVSGEFTWTPTEDDGPGVFDVTITVTDSDGQTDSETIQIEVTEQNKPPVMATIGAQEIDEEQELTFTVSATDSDVPSQSLTYSLDDGAPTGAAIDSVTGVFRWTPENADGPGVFDVTIRVTDAGGASDSETVTITVNGVNHAPVLGAIGDKSVNEGSPLEFVASATDTELPSDSLSYSLDVGAPLTAAIDSTTGEFSWTPAELDGPGVFRITVRVTDSAGLTDSETIQISVAEANQPPVLGAIGDREVESGDQLLFTAMATDSDIPTQSLTYSLDAGAPDGATIRPSDGFFSWTPSAAHGDGPFEFTVRVSDGNGGDDFETITVNLVEVNHFPVLATIGNRAAVEGVELTFTASATDANLPSDALTFSLDASAPAAATIDPVSGVFRWTPSESDGPGFFDVTVRVTDSKNATDFETIRINVAEANQAPVLIVIGDRTLPERTHLTFTVFATDADLPAGLLTYSLDAGAPPTASFNSTSGVFGWTPSESDGPGEFDLTFRVTDNRGATDFETIRISVTEVNTAPVLGFVGDRTTRIGDELSFTAVANDIDVPVDTLSYSLDAGAPSGASIDPSSGIFSWTPTAGHGVGTFDVTIRVADDEGMSDFETISIVVTEANQPPVLNAIGAQTVTEGTQLTFSASASDPDVGDTLTYSLDAGAPSGAFINSINGAFAWQPSETQGPAIVSVTVRVTDSEGASDFETISIDVSEGNLSPVLGPIGNQNGTEGTELSFTATATDPDLPANTLTFSLDAGAPPSAEIDANTGLFRWTPAESDGPGSFNITVRVSDNEGGTDFEVIRVDVPEANQPPVLDSIGDQFGQEGVRLRFNASAADSDLPLQTLTYSLDPGQPAGAVIDSSTGAFDWTPNSSVGAGTFDVTIRVEDGAGGSDFETITITIAEGMTALDRYVATDDPTYGYTSNTPVTGAGYTMHVLDLTSQTWMDDTVVQNPVWKHWVSIIVPDGATSESAILFVDGGSNPASAPTTPDTEALAIALNYGQILVHVPTIPNQPQVFLEEGVGRVEDEIISYTFDKYLNTGDESYPLLLPMVKSAVAAMDATQDYAQGQTFNIENFFVTGASKRGWTSWLTAAVDSRVSALAPLVIDFLNLDEQMQHHRDNYTGVTDRTIGGYSDSVHDYVDFNIMSRLSTPEGQALLKIVDPYEYRDRLTQPKYLVNGAGDEFFVPDSGQFYLSDLQGPTYVRYVPNTDHSLNVDATDGLANFFATVNDGTALPEFSWDVEGNREVIRVNTVDTPTSVKLWQATNPNSLDFRMQTFGANWTSTDLTDIGGGEYLGQVAHPASGGTAFFVELTYEVNGRTLTFTTEASIAKPLAAENTAPVLEAIGDHVVNENQLLTFSASATDVDIPVQTLTYSLDVGAPAGALIDSATGLFTWTPTEDVGPGTFDITVRVTDSLGGTDSEEISVGVIEINQPPILGAIGDKLVSESNELSFVATATDPDLPESTLTFSLDAGAPAAATIDPDSGLFQWSPTAADGPGVFNITVRVTDSDGASDSEEITVQVTEGVASSVVIDGSFDDWAMLSSYMDPVDDQHDTDHTAATDIPEYVDHEDVDLLEFKVTHDADSFYFYFRATGKIGNTQAEDLAAGKRAGRYYAIVTIDLDNDDTTGYGLHGGGYFPTTDGYDMNGELEFYGGEINTGHYLLHGAQNDAELEQSFDEQSNGQYIFGGDATQGPFTPGFVNIVPGDYDHYTQWVYKDNDPANGGNDSITFVQDKGPVVPGIVTQSLSADGHELEMKVPFRGFLVDSAGAPIVSIGQTVDISFSLEASGELSGSVSPSNPNGSWASDTADPLVGYVLDPVSTSPSSSLLIASSSSPVSTNSTAAVHTYVPPVERSLFSVSDAPDQLLWPVEAATYVPPASVAASNLRSWIEDAGVDSEDSVGSDLVISSIVETTEVPVTPDGLLPAVAAASLVDTAFLPSEWTQIQASLEEHHSSAPAIPQTVSRIQKLIPKSKRAISSENTGVVSQDASTGRATVVLATVAPASGMNRNTSDTLRVASGS